MDDNEEPERRARECLEHVVKDGIGMTIGVLELGEKGVLTSFRVSNRGCDHSRDLT